MDDTNNPIPQVPKNARELLSRHLTGDVPVLSKKKDVPYSVKKMLKAKTEEAFRQQTKCFKLACLKRELLRIDRYMDMLDEIDKRLMLKLANEDLGVSQLATISDLVVKGLDRSNKLIDQISELTSEVHRMESIKLTTQTQTLTIEGRSVVRDTTNKILSLIQETSSMELSEEQTSIIDNIGPNTNISISDIPLYADDGDGTV